MTDAIVQWLLSAGEGKFLATVLISMLPVIELRGGCPPAWQWGFRSARPFSRRCSAICFPFRLSCLFARRGFAWVRAHIPRLGRWVDRIERKAEQERPRSCAIRRGGCCSLSPCRCPARARGPGALIAALLDLRLKLAVPAITAGVFLAGIIISLLTYGAAALL